MLTDDETLMLVTDDDTFDRLSIDNLSIVHLLFIDYEAKSKNFWSYSCYMTLLSLYLNLTLHQLNYTSIYRKSYW